MKNDLDGLTDKIDFEQIIRVLIGVILLGTTVSIVIFGMIPLMEKATNEIKAYEAMTPQERAQYEKESKQQRYEEKIDIYVDTETGIEYLIYKDYHYGIIGGGNDVIIPRYDEYGNVKTNSTYLELK